MQLLPCTYSVGSFSCCSSELIVSKLILIVKIHFIIFITHRSYKFYCSLMTSFRSFTALYGAILLKALT